MKCVCCDRILNDFEATRKSVKTGQYLDTCNKCIKGLGIETIDRDDLPYGEDFNDACCDPEVIEDDIPTDLLINDKFSDDDN